MAATNHIKVGVIGAGKRAASYFRDVPEHLASAIQIQAVADPSPERRGIFIDVLADGKQVNVYDRGADLIDREDLDALIIGSPNHVHTQDAIAAMAKGIPTLLEKPVAVSVEQCQQLWEAYERYHRPPVFVGFVLRYTPFYSRVKAILEEGQLGQVLSLDMDENIHSFVTAQFFRGWRRWDQFSGGFMVEKCCHDFDILNWLAGAKAQRVFSMARRSHFVPRPRSEQHARFDREVLEQAVLDYESPIAGARLAELSHGSLYETPSDVADHQAVMIEFENGILSCFTACHAQPRNTRRTRICGSNAALEGDIEQARIRVDRHSGEGFAYVTEQPAIPSERGGHYGGDAQLKEAFWRTAAGDPTPCQAGIQEGIEAVLVALAAEASKKVDLPVDLASWRAQVFSGQQEHAYAT